MVRKNLCLQGVGWLRSAPRKPTVGGVGVENGAPPRREARTDLEGWEVVRREFARGFRLWRFRPRPDQPPRPLDLASEVLIPRDLAPLVALPQRIEVHRVFRSWSFAKGPYPAYERSGQATHHHHDEHCPGEHRDPARQAQR